MKLLMEAQGLDAQVQMHYIMHSGYVVTYGAQSTAYAEFKDALEEFKSCVLHSATCAGLLD